MLIKLYIFFKFYTPFEILGTKSNLTRGQEKIIILKKFGFLSNFTCGITTDQDNFSVIWPEYRSDRWNSAFFMSNTGSGNDRHQFLPNNYFRLLVIGFVYVLVSRDQPIYSDDHRRKSFRYQEELVSSLKKSKNTR